MSWLEPKNPESITTAVEEMESISDVEENNVAIENSESVSEEDESQTEESAGSSDVTESASDEEESKSENSEANDTTVLNAEESNEETNVLKDLTDAPVVTEDSSGALTDTITDSKDDGELTTVVTQSDNEVEKEKEVEEVPILTTVGSDQNENEIGLTTQTVPILVDENFKTDSSIGEDEKTTDADLGDISTIKPEIIDESTVLTTLKISTSDRNDQIEEGSGVDVTGNIFQS